MRVQRALNVLIYYLSALVPRSRSRVVFGAWHGHRYSDNPRYLLEHVLEMREDLDLVWCGKESTRRFVPTGGNFRFVRRGGILSLWEIARARTVFVTHGYEDVSPYNVTCRASLVYLGHGLAIKNMGSREAVSSSRNPFINLLRKLWRAPFSHTYYVASSSVHRQKLIAEYGTQGCREDNTLPLGQPRCDLFIQAGTTGMGQSVRQQLTQTHGIPEGKLLVTYMPTFRTRASAPFSFLTLTDDDARRLQSILDRRDAVLAERGHFVDGVLREHQPLDSTDGVFDLSTAEEVDSLELLLATDLLITDYSGAYVDFLLLDRPVVHFAYDQESYVSTDRGLYFELEEVAGGPVLASLSDLLQTLDVTLKDPGLETTRRSRVRKDLLTYERGVSCETVAQRLLPPSQ